MSKQIVAACQQSSEAHPSSSQGPRRPPVQRQSSGLAQEGMPTWTAAAPWAARPQLQTCPATPPSNRSGDFSLPWPSRCASCLGHSCTPHAIAGLPGPRMRSEVAAHQPRLCLTMLVHAHTCQQQDKCCATPAVALHHRLQVPSMRLQGNIACSESTHALQAKSGSGQQGSQICISSSTASVSLLGSSLVSSMQGC